MEAPADTSSPLKPLQRILQADGRRYSLKLEPPFWDALELAARERSMKLGRLIAELAAGRRDDGNLASYLRVFCLTEGERRLQIVAADASQASLAAGATNVETLVELCPAPCLVMTRDRRIVRVNSAFGRWYGSAYVNLPGKTLDHFFKLRTASSYETVIAAFETESMQAAKAQLLYVVPGRVVAGAARMMPVARVSADEFSILIMVEGSAPA
jgi:predicted DNA-binding ribbon-helix-helix protein